MNRRRVMSTTAGRVLLGVLVLVAVAATGCAGGGNSGPPDIAFGRDVCAECHMIISEPRFAAAYRVGSEKPLVFDDIADMVNHARKAGDIDGMTAWVHDYRTEKWMNATDAWYVRSSELETPMGGGVVAFRRRREAELFNAKRGGELLRWAELADAVAKASNSGDGTSGSTTPEQERQVHP